jgi:hypothetical protein
MESEAKRKYVKQQLMDNKAPAKLVDVSPCA